MATDSRTTALLFRPGYERRPNSMTLAEVADLYASIEADHEAYLRDGEPGDEDEGGW